MNNAALPSRQPLTSVTSSPQVTYRPYTTHLADLKDVDSEVRRHRNNERSRDKLTVKTPLSKISIISRHSYMCTRSWSIIKARDAMYCSQIVAPSVFIR